MPDELLNMEDILASYGEEDVLRGVTLSVAAGEILCIVGESGSGKSTLFRVLCRDERVVLSAGRIYYDGQELTGMSDRDVRCLMGHGIGLIPQNPNGSFNPIRPFEKQFREMFLSHGKDYDAGAVLRALQDAGLSDGERILKSRPYEMSGGMNQRIAVCAAMLLKPRLLLCDEATSALDVTSARRVVEMLMDYRRQKGAGILMVTHHLGIAKMMADTIGIMRDGKIVEYGSTEKIFSSPSQEYTRKLIADVPRLNAR